jgi:hypothetical protein
MTDNNLLAQLKCLKKMKADATWLKSNREILLSQIANSGAKELSSWHRMTIDARSFFSAVSQPAMAFASLLLVLVGASSFGHLAFGRMKPNDSLYIARIISEKAKLTTVFNDEERDKLEVKFAANHAEAITEVLAAVEVNEENADQVAQLNESFNKELDTVRAKMAPVKKNNHLEDVPVLASNTEEEIILTAGNNKDDKGLELQIANGTVDTDNATQTEEIKEDKTTEDKEAATVLDEAKALFDNKEYDSALNKLKEVQELIK